jgi:hypothetical protein
MRDEVTVIEKTKCNWTLTKVGDFRFTVALDEEQAEKLAPVRSEPYAFSDGETLTRETKDFSALEWPSDEEIADQAASLFGCLVSVRFVDGRDGKLTEAVYEATPVPARIATTRWSGSLAEGYGVRDTRVESLKADLYAKSEKERDEVANLVGENVYVYCDYWHGGSLRTWRGFAVQFEEARFPALAERLKPWNPNEE